MKDPTTEPKDDYSCAYCFEDTRCDPVAISAGWCGLVRIAQCCDKHGGA